MWSGVYELSPPKQKKLLEGPVTFVNGIAHEGKSCQKGPKSPTFLASIGNEAVSYTHLTLPTNREV